MRPAPLALAGLLLSACAAPAARRTAAPVVPAPPPEPPGVQLRPHAANVVDAEAAREVIAYLRHDAPALDRGMRVFYEHFEDAYDFVYLFTDGQIEDVRAMGVFQSLRTPAIPSIGLRRALRHPNAPPQAPHLRGVAGMNLVDSGIGPTLHETAHYWGVYLDARFGLGRDRDQHLGNHWGMISARGQLGGFDPSTVRCAVPAPALPLGCGPSPDGVIRARIGWSSGFANGGDVLGYSPLELYLMGLLPRAEVGGPFVVLDGAHYVDFDRATDRMSYEFAGAHTVSVEDIVRVHGERPPAPPEERAFRAAFVVLSAAPVSRDRLNLLERWAAVFGNDLPHPRAWSFERATGGRATMNTRLGRAR